MDNEQIQQQQHQQQQQQHRRSFFQLAGHKECFKLGLRPNTILKKCTGNEEQCLQRLQCDHYLAAFVPKVFGTIEQDGQYYLEMQDLLAGFKQASVMDVKMGYRTYREDELYSALRESTKLRYDMFDKMIEVDENEPTEEERQLRAVTKPRYMIWRESVSSTASLGFRIEGMRLKDGTIDKDFKTMKEEEHISRALIRYAKNCDIRLMYLNRLYDLRRALLKSNFFSRHELIGSSLLFVHDDSQASIWLIDFAKTYPLPENTKITHETKWELGNHEDGYLAGVDNLIRIFESIIAAKSITNGDKIMSQQQQQQVHNFCNTETMKTVATSTTKTAPTSHVKKFGVPSN